MGKSGRKKSGSRSTSGPNAESPQTKSPLVDAANGTASDPPHMEQIPESVNDASDSAPGGKADDPSVTRETCTAPEDDDVVEVIDIAEGTAEGDDVDAVNGGDGADVVDDGEKEEEGRVAKSEPPSAVRRFLGRWVSGRFKPPQDDENGLPDDEVADDAADKAEDDVPDGKEPEVEDRLEAHPMEGTPLKKQSSGVWAKVKDVLYTPFSQKTLSQKDPPLEEKPDTKESGADVSSTEKMLLERSLARRPTLRMLNDPPSESEETVKSTPQDRKRRSIFSYASSKKRVKRATHRPMNNNKGSVVNRSVVQEGKGIEVSIVSPNGREHIEWMKSVLDAKVGKVHWSNAQGASQIVPFEEIKPHEEGQITHATVELCKGVLYLSDRVKSSGYPELLAESPDVLGKNIGKGVMIHLNLGDNIQAVWERAMAAKASTLVDLKIQPGGSAYGVLVDPYGLEWAFTKSGPGDKVQE